MRSWMLAVVAAGCSGESTNQGKPAEDATARTPAPSPDGDLLAKGPTELGPAGKVMEKVAAAYNVGMVRCPLAGGGRARQIYGTERDQLFSMGPIWEMEWDPATAPPWDPLFDEVTSEHDWLTLLAVPGTTHAWVSTRLKTLAYEFPPAVAGQTVVCTGVHAAAPREVKGTVKADGPIPDGTLLVPCIVEKPPKIAPDGTFLASVPTPCTLWAEGPLERTEKIRVDEAPDPLELTLTLVRDPQQNPDRTWSPDGLKVVEDTFRLQQERFTATNTILQQLLVDFASDSDAKMKVQRWSFDYTNWGRSIDASLIKLKNPAAPVGAPRHE